MSLKRRIERLEQTTGTGAIEYVGIGRWDWSAEELAQAVAEARDRVGPGGKVIAVEYVKAWRGAEEAAG